MSNLTSQCTARPRSGINNGKRTVNEFKNEYQPSIRNAARTLRVRRMTARCHHSSKARRARPRRCELHTCHISVQLQETCRYVLVQKCAVGHPCRVVLDCWCSCSAMKMCVGMCTVGACVCVLRRGCRTSLLAQETALPFPSRATTGPGLAPAGGHPPHMGAWRASCMVTCMEHAFFSR